MAHTTKTTRKLPHQRREGGKLDPEALDNHLLARGLGSIDLAKLTRLDISTITSARRGHRVSRRTVLLIVDALDRVPIRPTIATLVGIDVPLVEKKRRQKVA